MKKIRIFLFLLLSVNLLFSLTGCNSQSQIKITRWNGIEYDPNEPIITAAGKAADTLAAQVAANIQTAQGRLSAAQEYNVYLYPALIIMFVGGLIFWGFTRSHYSWVIPSASIAGLFLLTAFARYAEYCVLGVMVIVIAVLVWKAIEYQKERNKNGEENGSKTK